MSKLIHKTIFDGMPTAAMVLDTDLIFVDANDAYCRAVQRQKSDLVGNYVFDVFPDTPERIMPVMEMFQSAVAGEATKLEAQPYKLLLADGRLEDRVWDVTQFPIRCDAGNVEFIVQRCEDVTEREALREQRDLVVAELNHRVRNALTVVQSVAAQTGQTSPDIQTFLKSFNGRLAAMSRNFAALTDSHWRGLDFETVIRTELEPYLGPHLDRVQFDGAPVTLSVRASKTTSMLVHELVTNASKYGFLTQPGGRLHCRWRIEGDMLRAEWLETGLQGIATPNQHGFGFQLFDLMTNIEIVPNFEPDGLKLSLSVPVSIGVASGEVEFAEA